LNPETGYIRTARARQKVGQWFRRQAREQNVERGRALLEKELRRLSLDLKVEEVALMFRKDNPDEFFARLGTGDTHPASVAAKLVEKLSKEQDLGLPPPEPRRLPTVEAGVRVKNVGDLLTNLARCCNPVPGDPILGYITRGRGVTIHRQDCPNVLNTTEHERLIEVSWGQDLKTYPVSVRIRAYDRTRLLRDIGEVLGNEDVSMVSGDIVTQKETNLATFTVVLQVTDISQLSRVLAKLEQLPNVLEARRITG
jgi:GTP pyrophosphokinase